MCVCCGEVADFCPPDDVLQHVSEEVRNELLADREFVIEADSKKKAESVLHYVECVYVRYAPLERKSKHYAKAVKQVGAEVLEHASLALRSDPTMAFSDWAKHVWRRETRTMFGA